MVNSNSELRFIPETHEYFVGSQKAPSVTQVLSAVNIHQASGFATEHDMWVGTASHKAIELHIRGTLDESTLDERLAPRLDAFKAFQAMTGFICDETETPHAHPSVLVAGTPDIVGHFPDGTPAIIDEKNGLIQPSTAIQSAGYAFILQMPKAKRFGLHLKQNGKFGLLEFTDPHDHRIWMQALSIYGWIHNTGGLKK